MNKISTLGLFLIAAMATGCVYPALKTNPGGGGTGGQDGGEDDADVVGGKDSGRDGAGNSTGGKDGAGNSTGGKDGAGNSTGGKDGSVGGSAADAAGTGGGGGSASGGATGGSIVVGGSISSSDTGEPDAPASQPDVPAGGSGGGGTSTGGTSSTGGSSGGGSTCPVLTNPTNGSVSAPATTVGSKAAYQCDPGYRSSGAVTRTCQSDGTWDGTAPTCAIVDCGALSAPAKGSVSGSTSYGSTAKYACEAGYGITGTSTRTCQADGTWSGTTPTCTPADCPTAPSPANGGVTTTGATYGATATYRCDPGYTLSVATVRTCQADGTWSGTTPTCTIVDCQAPAGILNGKPTATTTTYGSTATYKCDLGYILSGVAAHTCQADGTWSGTTPICTIVDCQSPPGILNGKPTATTTTWGSTATYTCNTGYSIQGTTSSTCQADGTWSGTAPTCSIVDCGAAPTIPHGTLGSATGTIYNSTATYSCNTGYSFSSLTTSRTCQADGTWSTAPICAIQRLDLTISKIGAGTGVVTSTDSAINCGSTCVATYDYGTTVNLSARADTNQTFMGWSGAGCTGVGSCQVILSSAVTVKANFSPPPNIVFVTSVKYTTNLGGLAGADTKCNQRAAAGGLAGTYRAFLSTNGTPAVSRLGTASGWVRPDGKPVINSIADIQTGRVLYPPRLDELKNDVGANQLVMTATALDGSNLTYDVNKGYTSCSDYTSDSTLDPPVNGFTPLLETGMASGGSSVFMMDTAISCGQQARIFCFGVDRQAQVVATPVQGRYAFRSKNPWYPGGGIASADAQCQADAVAAKLPGTYLAMLAQNGYGGRWASRFNSAAGTLPWMRPDGVLLAPTAATLFSTSLLDAAPIIGPDGSAQYGTYLLWTGAASPTTDGTDAANCNNWTSGLHSSTSTAGQLGETSAASLYNTWVAYEPCDFQWGYVVCLQQ